MKCKVLNCQSKYDKGSYRFYRFPKDKTLQKKWKKFCSQPRDFDVKNARICSVHFLSDDIERNIQYEMGFLDTCGYRLKPGTVPTVKNISGCLEMISERSPSPESGTLENEDNFNITMYDSGRHWSDNELGSNSVVLNDHSYAQSSIFHEKIQNENNVPSITENIDIKYSDHTRKIHDLRQKIAKLKKENSALKNQERITSITMEELRNTLSKSQLEIENLDSKLRQLFSEGQIKKLKTGSRKQLWSADDIEQSFTLYTASPKAYGLLLKKDFPLPSIRTLQRWAPKLNIPPASLEDSGSEFAEN